MNWNFVFVENPCDDHVEQIEGIGDASCPAGTTPWVVPVADMGVVDVRCFSETSPPGIQTLTIFLEMHDLQSNRLQTSGAMASMRVTLLILLAIGLVGPSRYGGELMRDLP